jgi:hypothetical protein
MTGAQELIEKGRAEAMAGAQELIEKGRAEAMAGAQELIEKGRAEAMAGAQELIEKGRAEAMAGAQELVEKSRLERGRAILTRQLEARFGKLSTDQAKKIDALNEKEIDDLSIRLLTATRPEELGL